MDTKLLRQKILDLAIRGKLVPQDPNDEPASVLLEKIRVEKERLIKEKKIKPDKKKGLDKSHYGKEVPFEVPNGWEVTEMQNICSLLDGEKRNDISLPYLDVKFLRNQSGINLKKSGKFVSAETNLVLVDGENSGEIFKTNIDGYQGSTLKIIQISEEINEEYIFYILKKEHKLFKESKTGSAIPHLNKKLFREYPIPLPPLLEQYRIVDKIEKLFDLIYLINENKLSLEQYITQTKSKVLDLAIRGKLVPQDPEEEPASMLLKKIRKDDKIKRVSSDTSHYPFEVPEGWIACQLYEICDFERGVTFPSSAKQTLKRENTIACVRTANVQEQLELDDLWYIDKSFLKNNRKKLLRKNDIIISTANSKELVGKTSFVENINEEMCFGGFVMVIRTNFINNKFLFYYLRDCFYNGIFSKKASQTTNIANINTTILGNLVIKVPPPAEQQRIVNKIEEIFKILDIMQENLQTNV